MGEVAKQPPGMPRPDVIRTEVIRQSLTRADADYLIDHWLGNGFKTGRNKIRDWKAVIRKWKTENWFPSQKWQKSQTDQDRERMSKQMKRLKKIHDGDRHLF